ncbi:hypothetical protein K505DRAFT_420332 [Melanomma pulvis-pyrius CBS 109.77]|uniref:F-box domain-containing protein n=1 Tax=Melanomma pulvis-pyrius CBS 109.77 TaxID=1314802 RepID=A0A6A6X0E0_9PLEO|nr:hypothetical protein K505DRAFT_420332 [Melanomma pulvis-pyrius CBS 109.77]
MWPSKVGRGVFFRGATESNFSRGPFVAVILSMRRVVGTANKYDVRTWQRLEAMVPQGSDRNFRFCLAVRHGGDPSASTCPLPPLMKWLPVVQQSPWPQWDRSQAPYSFRPEDEDAILQAISYHREDIDLEVLSFPPGTHDQVTISLSSTFRLPPDPRDDNPALVPSSFRQSTSSPGDIDLLPVELIHDICLRLDMESLWHLRQTSSRTRQIIHCMHEYKTIVKHALSPLCALFRTMSASSVSLEAFFRLLCTQNCAVCGDGYGNLVFLPTWIRCCSWCLENYALQISTTPLTVAREEFKLSEASLMKLPTFTALPRDYDKRRDPRYRETVVPTELVFSAYREENDKADPTWEMMLEVAGESTDHEMCYCAMPSYNLNHKQIQNGLCCKGCQIAVRDGIVPIDPTDPNSNADRIVYERNQILRHFVHCRQAQILWSKATRAHDDVLVSMG